MVKALFDTNILVDYLRGVDEARIELARYQDPAISVITWIEVVVGATPATEEATRAFLNGFRVIALDEGVAEAAASLRRTHRMKLRDAIIWASAAREGRLLVTRDKKAFPASDPGVRLPYKS